MVCQRILSAWGALLILASLAAAQSPIALQRSEAAGITLRIANSKPAADTLALEDRQGLLVRFRDQSGFETRQQYDLPRQTALLAVPHASSEHSVVLTGARWVALNSDLLPPPAGTLTGQPGPAASFDPSGEQDLPALKLASVSWYRHLRFARVHVMPLRVRGGRVEYLAEATIRLNWRNAPSPASPTSEARAELMGTELPLYEQAVLNRADVSAYARPSVPALAKTAKRLAGEYLVMRTTSRGIYRVEGATLAAAGLDLSQLVPDQLRLYNNGGRLLPEGLNQSRPDTLIEQPIVVEDGGDGRFDEQDALYFFAMDVSDWQYEADKALWSHYTNPYTVENAYWLSWDTRETGGRRLQPVPALTGMPARSTALHLSKIENDLTNPINSGRDWFGREMNLTSSRLSYDLPLKSASRSQNARLRLRVVSETSGRHTIAMTLNSQSLGAFSFFGSTSGEYLNLSGQTREFEIESSLLDSENTLELQFSSSASFGKVFVDWIELVAEDALQAADGVLEFVTDADSGLTAFRMDGLGSGARAYEISNPLSPRTFSLAADGGSLILTDSLRGDRPARFYVSAEFKSPERLTRYTVNDLRSPARRADMLIITHADFMTQAERFADHKRQLRGFDVEVVDIDAVLAEFGWGLVDPTAIRDLVAYAFERWELPPRYLLLIGDGSFDYRDLARGSNKSLVPTYQTTEFDELISRNLEPFFTYVSGLDRDMDLSIGRIPAQNVEEATAVIDKIIKYEASPEFGFWRTRLTMVADDELVTGGRDNNETIHTIDAESIAENTVPDYVNLSKIYLMEFPSVRTASISGVRKPQAQNLLIDNINKGTLIVNYVGHGNSTQWAHEVIFEQVQDLPRINNGARLPFFVAATCDFGRFDKLFSQSFPEELLHARDRGIVGILTSSRVVYANPNATFNREYYRKLFPSTPGAAPVAVGDAMVLARLFTSSTTNDEKYTILGDPSMYLALPQSLATVDSLVPDSLFALNRTRVQGRITPAPASPGEVELLVFDDRKNSLYTTQRNARVRYILPGNLLFRGSATLDSDQFDLSFIVPKDITYGGRKARASLYGYGQDWEAVGFLDDLPISLSSAVLFDNTGPTISIAFAGREAFTDGDPVAPNERMIATIRDSISGINVTGEIGHKITLTFDGDKKNQIDVTSDFVYFPNDFLGGQLSTQLPDLAPGLHTGELKAWDNSNNSAKLTFSFLLTESDDLRISDVLNYPNPFSSSTEFTFVLNSAATVDISIYTVAGRMIHKMEAVPGQPGFNVVAWDGLDHDGDALANGVYLYRVVARGTLDSGESAVADHVGRIAVKR